MWSSLEGLVIGGRYEIERHIATGGMAAVFLGWDHRVERPVAIKVLRQLEHADGPSIARFQREAHAAAMLNHANVVRAYDFVEDGGCYYLVMEYVDGLNLKQHLRRCGPLPAAEALRIVGQVCAALSAAHAQGFIHRDVKPQNILLDEHGVAKVTDFGIVHITQGPTMTTDGAVLGTADYIAPEQARGEQLSPATDVYAVGVVLYEMLTGRLPFTGPTPMAVATQHATASAPPPRTLMPSLSPYVEAVVMRALQKHPARRYDGAAAMAVAVRMAEEALRIPALAEPLTERAREPIVEDHEARTSAEPAAVGVYTAASVEAARTQDGLSPSGAPRGGPVPAASGRAPAHAAPGADTLGAGWRDLAAELLDAAQAMPIIVPDGPDAGLDGMLAGAGADVVGGVAAPHELPVPWLRVLVVTVTMLALLVGNLALQLWLHAHGGGAGIVPHL